MCCGAASRAALPGDRVTLVLNRVEGSLRFFRGEVDQGVAFKDGLVGRRLVPALVMGSTNGGKTTTVTICSSMDAVPAAVRSVRAAPRLMV